MRRTALAITGTIDTGLIEAIAAVAGRELGWDEERRRAEIEELVADLENYHGVDRSTLDRRTKERTAQCALSTTARMNRLFTDGGCLDVAIDHGVCNEPSFLVGLEDMRRRGRHADRRQARRDPDGLRPGRPAAESARKDKPALVMRIDMGNPYNS